MNCPACTNQMRLHVKLKFKVYICPSCKLLHSDAKFDDSLAPALDEQQRAGGLKNLRVKNFNAIIQELKKLTDGSKKLSGLEIGCGNGWWLEICKQHQIKCIGIEPDDHFTSYHQQQGLDVIYDFYPSSKLPTDQKFDLIIFNDVFEHIEDLDQLIRQLHQDLKPDGLLIINIPMSNGFFYKIATVFNSFGSSSFLNRMWQFDFPSPHINYFNSHNLSLLIERSGFKKVQDLRLETLDVSSVKERIKADKKISGVKANFLSLGIKLASPVVKFSNPDIRVFFFKKR
jgi:SAM-dependent methyltransferase